MCRHLAYLGPSTTLAGLVTEPKCGLYEQSWAPRMQRHGTVNADGFGLGWYPYIADGPPRPARYRRSVPIWADPNLPDLARTIHSPAVLAAVRDATPGTSQDECAAAPYAYDHWLFSHNGSIPDWRQLPGDLGVRLATADLLGLEAGCDSALLWALLQQRLRAGEPPAGALADVTRRIAAVRPGARLNLLLTDGRTITAVRHGDTLWYRGGLDDVPSVLVASEPDATDGWQEVPEGSLLMATPRTVRTIPLAPVRAVERTAPHDELLLP
ncbi:ergothioneine biosynthesis protein EgtC [Streptomyces gobiensis]|uniref:ergothioneine biosynthesis protein EgtC n=1 Tax=Streptomyces gobiensis TaxID=2875706 RepID=UPI001E28CCB9|nr:ergothioneine biosynthesis protein EgtC [Streptomyces gobiensis]UGY92286.1 ergothioneine biosynthesis protein EgtC [Streptomyces gobiensis]